MTLARSWLVTLVGLDGHVVEVEADIAQGLPGLAITGLPDAALNEARDRVRAAVVNSGYPWPQRRVTLGLSPAALPKRGSGFDLALAAALLAADGVVPLGALHDVLLLGELGLDGRVRPVAGVLPAVLAAARAGFSRFIVPVANLAEARLLPDVQCTGVPTLAVLVALLRGEPYLAPSVPEPEPEPEPGWRKDLLEVAGQPVGRLALEVAAAGGHNLLMTGSPGCGKSLLAERMPGILPPLSLAEALEVKAIHSVAGQLPASCPLVSRSPFQAPHHGATAASIVGGGSGIAKPGVASLAHRGSCSWTRPPSSRGACWTPCASRWRAERSRSGGWAAPRPTPRASLCCSPPTPARAPSPSARARAGPSSGAATSPGCPVRCWTGSTCTCRSRPSPGPT